MVLRARSPNSTLPGCANWPAISRNIESIRLLDRVDIHGCTRIAIGFSHDEQATIRCWDLSTGRRQQLTLCYPHDAEPAAGLVSVLSPVGCALIGLRAGDIARWQTPSGEGVVAQVLSVLFQPEASGDYTL
ncbi:MAG: GreA/GreB family elongation factor [Burkholderiaceae bacterium]